jgi:hypothetical protein
VALFAVFPEAHNMLLSWGKKNLETLNSETARKYLLEVVIPFCEHQCNIELTRLGVAPFNNEQFMKFVNLKSLTVVTTWRWLRLLGFSYCENKKCYYTDGHERADNVRYRIQFIKKYFEYEFRTYRWIQISDEDAIRLESLKKNPLRKGLGLSYSDEAGKAMREYHIDCHDALKEFVNDEYLPFGANLSVVNFPEGERPLIFVGQDESIIYQYLFSSKSWHGPEGEGTLHPKGQGDGVMASAFCGDQIGFGLVLTDEQLSQVNALRHDYVSKEEATFLTETTEKPDLTRKMFDDDMVDSPFLKLFRYGQNHDGYWTHRHMKLQFEDLVDCLKILHPNHDFLCLFDQSSGHTKKRDEGLNALNMNASFGGKAATMRETKLCVGCVGPHATKWAAKGAELCRVGELQQLSFPPKDQVTENDGPFWMTAAKRLEMRDDKWQDSWCDKNKTYKDLRKELEDEGLIRATQKPRLLKLKEIAIANNIALAKKVSNQKERFKTIADLLEDISKTDFQFERRSYRLPELQGIATARNIDLKVIESKLIEGWAGKPKGLLQVLWETGWINPDVDLKKYIKAGKPGRDFEDDGDLKADVAPFVLKHLMVSRPDFKQELSDLQHLGTEISSETNSVIVDFTPKYHAEIAGEGVECGWGFAKKIHRRMPLKMKRDFDDFTKTVRDCLLKVTPERSRRFRRHCRKYMLAYAKIAEEAQEEAEEVASAPFDRIEALVKCCFKSVDAEQNRKKKRKNRVELSTKPKKTELKQLVSIAEAYKQRSTKCRAIRSEDDEQIRLDRIARSDGDVNVEAQQRTYLTHWSAMDTETTYLENEVELYLLDEEQC